MKNILIFILACSPILLFAQSAERQVIGSSGNSYSGSTVRVSSTVGEAVTTSATTANVIVTQGFQQPDELSIGIAEIESGLSINAYPNPTTSSIVLDIQAEKAMKMEVMVSDLQGKLTSVPSEMINVTGNTKHVMDLSKLAGGNYFLVFKTENKLLGTIQVQKLE